MAINTTITDVNDFLDHIVSSTNMKCVASSWSASCEAATIWQPCSMRTLHAAAPHAQRHGRTGAACSVSAPLAWTSIGVGSQDAGAPRRCLTPPSALSGACGFLAANLYAKSVFGEDALVNLSVEQGPDGKLAGYIRIRHVHACAA